MTGRPSTIWSVRHWRSSMSDSRIIPSTSNLPADLPAVYVDAPLVTQVLVNLLDNCVRSTRRRERASASRQARTKAVRVSSTTTGPGLPPGDPERCSRNFSVAATRATPVAPASGWPSVARSSMPTAAPSSPASAPEAARALLHAADRGASCMTDAMFLVLIVEDDAELRGVLAHAARVARLSRRRRRDRRPWRDRSAQSPSGPGPSSIWACRTGTAQP